MDDLVRWLGKQLDADAERARKAAALCGCHPPAPAWSFCDGDEPTDGRILVVDDPHPTIKRKLGRRWNGSYDGLFMAEFIAEWDPARVLREIDAKRRIVDRYAWLREHGDTGGTAWVLPLLALPYADRPGYQESWRP